MNTGSETSVYCVHAVLYESLAAGERDWQPLGNAEWAEMHIFKEAGGAANAFRMVAWLADSSEVILNSNLGVRSEWACSAGDFAELVNPGEKVYGFYFPDDQTASETAEAVTTAIAEVKSAVRKAPAVAPPPVPSTPAARRQSLAQAVESQSRGGGAVDVSDQVTKLKFGASNFKSAGSGGGVTLMEHSLHVSYDEERACYEGLPPEWKHINQQFGVPLSQVPKSRVPGYDERIPSVLLMMQRLLVAKNGRDQVGIFRLAPDAEDCKFAKAQINSGEFKDVSDVNVIANLIKVWFREMPIALFSDVPKETIYRIAEKPYDAAAVAAEYATFPEPSRSLLLWLLDLMADIVTNEAVNKMGAKNMAIVLSPNLFQINSENPMAALTMAQKVADFTTRLLGARLMEKYGYDARLN
jgi:hypothetical protein